MYLLSYHKTKESQPNLQKIPTFAKLKRSLKELFDPNFASCLAWRLAAEFAVVFSRDFSRRNELYKVYEIEIETARALDMSEGYKRLRNKRNKYASAR